MFLSKNVSVKGSIQLPAKNASWKMVLSHRVWVHPGQQRPTGIRNHLWKFTTQVVSMKMSGRGQQTILNSLEMTEFWRNGYFSLIQAFWYRKVNPVYFFFSKMCTVPSQPNAIALDYKKMGYLSLRPLTPIVRKNHHVKLHKHVTYISSFYR